MYRQCHYQSCLKLNPPIQFGGGHSYSTRTNRHFANIARSSTAFRQKSFCYKGMTWWNALPSDFYQISGHTALFCAGSPGLFVVAGLELCYLFIVYIVIICMSIVVS